MPTDPPSLPDYIKPNLDIIFIGINPGAYSASVGMYFATRTNRFWGALTASGIVRNPKHLNPGDEKWLIDVGIGFTDVVKRPSSSASELRAADYRVWAPITKQKLLQNAPLIVCFNGLMGYRAYLRYAEEIRLSPRLGLQDRLIGSTSVFVAPNPSAANAAFSLSAITDWYRELGALRNRLKLR